MNKKIELEPEQDRLRIDFPYNRKLVDVMRSLPSRWFDRDTKAWYVPLKVAEETVGRLVRHDFAIGEQLRAFFEAKGVALDEVVAQVRQTHKPFITEDLMPPGTWTVAKLNHEVRELIREAFREEVWLAAEIQSFDRNRRRGHAFFELVHRPYQGGDPSARISAVMWADDRQRIERALDEDGGDVRLRDGLIVRFLVRVDFYTGQGRYQVAVSDIDLAYTSGTIHQNREAIIRELDAKGILEKNIERSWPTVPLKIGLITSDESDAFADFVHELERSGFGFQVDLFPAQVQGARTEESVLAALRTFARRADRYDAVAIVRGGGARSDLAYFDTQAIGEAVCNHPLKVIVGVGHQRDMCLLDFVAHSEKTPTAAAQYFVERVRKFVERRDDLQDKILDVVTERIDHGRDAVRLLSEHALRVIGRKLEHHERQIERISYEITDRTNASLNAKRRRWERLARGIPAAARRRVDVAGVKVDIAAERLTPERLSRRFTRKEDALATLQTRLGRVVERHLSDSHQTLDQTEQRLRLLDPRRIIERGFAQVRGTDGRLVRSPREVEPEEPLHLKLARGEMMVRAHHTPDDPADAE